MSMFERVPTIEADFSATGAPMVPVRAVAQPDGKAFSWLYLAVGLIGGLVMVFLTPVGQVSDETTHFWRAYQLSRGQIIGQRKGADIGGNLPAATTALNVIAGRLIGKFNRRMQPGEYREDWAVRLDQRQRQFVDFHSYVVYSPVGYLPQTIGLRIGELFSDRLLVVFYGARLGNLLVGLTVIFLALRLAPGGHASLCALALMPMVFSQGCTASADGIVNACAILFFALLLRAAASAMPLRPFDYLRLFAPLLVITQMKFPYIGLVLLMLALPASVYGSKRRRWIAFGVFGFACFVAYLGWYMAIRHLTGPGRPLPGISIPAQQMFIVHHPFIFIGACFRAFYVGWFDYLQQFIGVFGWLDTPMPVPFYVAFILYLLVTFGTEKLPVGLTTVQARGWAATAVLVSVIMSLAFIYMYWDPVGATIVDGFQGRYLAPIALGIMLIFNFRHAPSDVDAWPRFGFTGLVGALGLLLMAITVARRFYPI